MKNRFDDIPADTPLPRSKLPYYGARFKRAEYLIISSGPLAGLLVKYVRFSKRTEVCTVVSLVATPTMKAGTEFDVKPGILCGSESSRGIPLCPVCKRQMERVET